MQATQLRSAVKIQRKPFLYVAFSSTLRGSMARRKVDRAWFEDRIGARFGSIRKLAEKMVNSEEKPMAHSRISRLLKGEQEPMIHEGLQLEELLDEDFDEILRRFGYRRRRR